MRHAESALTRHMGYQTLIVIDARRKAYQCQARAAPAVQVQAEVRCAEAEPDMVAWKQQGR